MIYNTKYMKHWGGQNIKKERNKALIADYYSGEYDTVGLIKKYSITSARIYTIIKREKEVKNENGQ